MRFFVTSARVGGLFLGVQQTVYCAFPYTFAVFVLYRPELNKESLDQCSEIVQIFSLLPLDIAQNFRDSLQYRVNVTESHKNIL